MLGNWVKDHVIPVLSRTHSSLATENISSITGQALELFVQNLKQLETILQNDLRDPKEPWKLYCNIRRLIEPILESPFFSINEDLKESILAIQSEILKSIHFDLPPASKAQQEIDRWNTKVSRGYNSILSPEVSLQYTIEDQDGGCVLCVDSCLTVMVEGYLLLFTRYLLC